MQKGNFAQRVAAQARLLGEQPERLKPVIAPATPCSTRSRSAQPWRRFLAGSPLCCTVLAVGLAVRPLIVDGGSGISRGHAHRRTDPLKVCWRSGSTCPSAGQPAYRAGQE